MATEWALKLQTSPGQYIISDHTEDTRVVDIWRERINSTVTIVTRECGEWTDD